MNNCVPVTAIHHHSASSFSNFYPVQQISSTLSMSSIWHASSSVGNVDIHIKMIFNYGVPNISYFCQVICPSSMLICMFSNALFQSVRYPRGSKVTTKWYLMGIQMVTKWSPNSHKPSLSHAINHQTTKHQTKKRDNRLKQSHLRMNNITGSNNHFRSLDLSI